jgi:rhodanese-related sulfurtransferase
MTRPALAVALAVALAACAPRSTAHQAEAAASQAGEPSAPAPGVVDPATAAALARAGARVVDVRTAQEYAAGHVPAALNVPFDRIAEQAAEIGGPGTPIVVYCRSGRRSAIAAEALRGLGYTKVYDAQRFDTWPQEGAAGR